MRLTMPFTGSSYGFVPHAIYRQMGTYDKWWKLYWNDWSARGRHWNGLGSFSLYVMAVVAMKRKKTKKYTFLMNREQDKHYRRLVKESALWHAHGKKFPDEIASGIVIP